MERLELEATGTAAGAQSLGVQGFRGSGVHWRRGGGGGGGGKVAVAVARVISPVNVPFKITSGLFFFFFFLIYPD